MNRRKFLGLIAGAVVAPSLPKPPLIAPGEVLFFLPSDFVFKGCAQIRGPIQYDARMISLATNLFSPDVNPRATSVIFGTKE